MKRILVTGGAGFIGSHLVQHLTDLGHEVTVLDILLRGNKIEHNTLKKVKLINGDVKDKNLVFNIMENIDIVYHFAAVLGVDVVADNPVETMDTEVIGMRNICEAGVLYGIEKIIYASTSGVYGHSAIEKSVTEDIIIDPRTSYAIAKRYNEIYLKALYEEKGLNSISVRFFNVYGERQDTRMVIPRFIEQAMNDNPITVFGDGAQTRDFTFIDDTIKAVMLLTEHGNGAEIFNIANEDEMTIGELADQIKVSTNSKSVITNLEAPKKRYDYEVERRVGSSNKMFQLTGFKPKTTLAEGLAAILNKDSASE